MLFLLQVIERKRQGWLPRIPGSGYTSGIEGISICGITTFTEHGQTVISNKNCEYSKTCTNDHL